MRANEHLSHALFVFDDVRLRPLGGVNRRQDVDIHRARPRVETAARIDPGRMWKYMGTIGARNTVAR